MTQEAAQIEVEVAGGKRALRTAATRERILDAAAGLFYEEGIRAVSADRVIAEVAINKGTFYRYFPSKDDLTVAYLQRRSAQEQEAARQIRESLPGDPAAVFRAMVAAAGEQACSPGFRGCPFINAAAEYADPAHPVRQAVDEHREWFRAMIQQQLELLDIADAPLVADALVLLRDGAMVSGYLSDPTSVAPALGRAVQDILAQAA
jgi:AcrR family transcriptional regulator